jgi:FkbH-like protein
MLRQVFLETLQHLLGKEPGVVVIHSSLGNLVPSKDFKPHDALYGLDRLVKNGWTVVLPAFTFSFCGGRPFHHQESRSEVGVLADWVLDQFPDARRTPHPIYSFVVVGPAAEQILACPSSTTFGDDSPFGLFERTNALLVMMGCGWEYATQFHRYEEQTAVPYRYFKTFTGRADLGDGNGERETRADMYVRELAVEPANDYSPAVERLRSEGSIRSAPLWRGRVEAVRVADLARVCREMLSTDWMAFVVNGGDVDYKLAKISRAAVQPPLRVAVLSSANVQLLRSALERDLPTLMPDQRLETYEVPFGQLHQALVDKDSELQRWRPQISIFCNRLEDLLSKSGFDGMPVELTNELVEQYADGIAAYHRSNGGWTIVHRFAALHRSADENGGRDTAVTVDRMNNLLESRLAELKQVLWVDTAAEAASAAGPAVDSRLWHLGRIPYAEQFSRRLARRWGGLILAALGKTARVIIVDLDNTLWGGVLGEDGLTGVQLGGDFPGNTFVDFQRVLKSLMQRGIALAVCSKNDEDLALKAIDTLPAMQFRSKEIAAHRINWRPKWDNIREIAEELNLSVESLLFVDDNPVEREAVRRNVPGVKVLELPTDPAGFVEALLASPWLEVAGVTAEDRKRVVSYQTRRHVKEMQSKASSLEDFLAGLEMKLHFHPLNDRNIARAAQLCAKTNQFNTTTCRYDQADLRRITAEGGDVVVLALEDRYSELENIGLLILRPSSDRQGEGLVDNYLLSCRVLGRGIETAVLHWALSRAVVHRWTALRGVVIETERNSPVRGVFQDAGFQSGASSGEWVALPTSPRATPSWLTLVDHLEAVSAK